MPEAMYTGRDIRLVSGDDLDADIIAFNTIDALGNKWLLSDLEGWWDLPDVSVPDDTRPFQEDGSYFSAGRYEARQITVSGFIVPGDEGPLAAVDARTALNRAMSLVRSTAILRVDETRNGGNKIAAVQLVAKPLTKFNTLKNTLEFNFQLRAADPRKYAVTTTTDSTTIAGAGGGRDYNRTFDYSYGAAGSDGLLKVDNIGDYNSFGVIVIRGPITSPSVEHLGLGRSMRLDLTLAVDEFVEINLKDKTILFNGTQSVRTTLDPGSSWFWMEPGVNNLRFTGYQTNTPHPEYLAADNFATNPSFETLFGVDGVKSLGGAAEAMAVSNPTYQTAVRSGAWASTGSFSLEHAVTASPDTNTYALPQGSVTSLASLGMSAGNAYTVSSFVNVPAVQSGTPAANARSIELRVTAASLGGSVTYSSDQAPNVVGTYRLSVSVTLPADSTAVELRLVNGADTGSLYWDAMMIEPGTAMSIEYFDGNSPFSTWDGPQNDSASSRPYVPAVGTGTAEITTRSAWIE